MAVSKSGKARTHTEEKKSSPPSHMQSSQRMQLFEDELKEIYLAENAIVKALPLMIENANSSDLIDDLSSHLAETKVQVAQLENVFLSFGKNTAAEKCEAITGLIKESEAIIHQSEEGSVKNKGFIDTPRKIDHYEVATYATFRQFEEPLGIIQESILIKTSLEEDHATEEKLTIVVVVPFQEETPNPESLNLTGNE